MKLRNWFRSSINDRSFLPARAASKRRQRCSLNVETLERRLTPTAGMLDPTFGVGGKVLTDFGARVSTENLARFVAQAGDTIVTVGEMSSPSDIAVARYNADGSLDPSFDGDGLKQLDLTGLDGLYEDGYDHATAMTVQADGKIVVVRASTHLFVGGGSEVASVFRLNTDGSLDTTFAGNGIARLDFGTRGCRGDTVAIQADGKIVVAGRTRQVSNDDPWDFAVARLNADGSLDAGFAGDGTLTLDVTSSDMAFGLALQTDGKIVFAGYASTPNTTTVVRLNSDGSLDNQFDGDGVRSLPFGSGLGRTPVAVQDDGRLVIAGTSHAGGLNQFVATRLNSNGSMDTTFDGDGVRYVDWESSLSYLSDMAVQSDDKVVLAGYTYVSGSGGAVVRLNSDGSLDGAFGSGGTAVIDFDQNLDIALGLVIADDSKLVVAGQSVGVDLDAALVRLNTDGSLDPTFAGDGQLTTDMTRAGTEQLWGSQSVAVQADGKVLVAGWAENSTIPDGSSLAVVRYNPDGALDATFAGDGIATFDLGARENVSVAIQPDGRIVVCTIAYETTTGSWDVLVARLNADGSLDATFAGDGSTTIDFGGYFDGATALVILADSRIMVSGYRGFFDDNAATNIDDFAVARLNSNGSLDTSFADDGITTLDLGSDSDRASAMALQVDGKILVAGTTNGNYAIVRYSSNGTLDTSFDGDGILLPGFNNTGLSGLAVQPDGRIVLATGSYQQITGGYDFLAARLNSDGSFDPSFSDDGIATIDLGTSRDIAMDVALQVNGRIVLIGSSQANFETNTAFVVARLNADGSVDTTFSDDGVATADFGPRFDVATSLAVQGDGNIVVAGFSNQSVTGGWDLALARFLGDVQDGDSDNDGLADTIDSAPATYSSDFSDGNTTGTIVDRGDQILTIVDAPNVTDGVLITAALNGGSTPATVSIVDGASTLSLQPGDQVIVTHGSVIVRVLAGTIETTFVAYTGEVATASLTAGNELTFKPESFVFSAPATNTETVQVLVNGSEIEVGSGQSVRSVQIDITPGSASNTLNLASNGVISVAILSTAGFDARTVNVASLLFAGAHATQSSFKDVNGDGIRDLVVNFRTQDTTLRLLYEQLVAEDINEDGVLDSSHEMARVSLTGLCQDGTALIGGDALDLFLSGKALRDMLAALAAAGAI
jgi:uncharacterized delta-60 repeat protein